MIPTLLVSALAALNAHGFALAPDAFHFTQQPCRPIPSAYACVYTYTAGQIDMEVPNGATINVYGHEAAHVIDFSRNVTIAHTQELKPLLFIQRHARVSSRNPAASRAAIRERLADQISACSDMKPVYLYTPQWRLPKPTPRLCDQLQRIVFAQ